MLLGNTVKFTQVRLGLVPEVLDAVEVVFAIGKELGRIDPSMPEAGNIQSIVAGQCIALDDGIGHHSFLQDGEQRGRFGISNDDRIDLSAPF